MKDHPTAQIRGLNLHEDDVDGPGDARTWVLEMAVDHTAAHVSPLDAPRELAGERQRGSGAAPTTSATTTKAKQLWRRRGEPELRDQRTYKITPTWKSPWGLRFGSPAWGSGRGLSDDDAVCWAVTS